MWQGCTCYNFLKNCVNVLKKAFNSQEIMTSKAWVVQNLVVICAFCGLRKYCTFSVQFYLKSFVQGRNCSEHIYWVFTVTTRCLGGKKYAAFLLFQVPGSYHKPWYTVYEHSSFYCNWLDCLNQWVSWTCMSWMLQKSQHIFSYRYH